MHIYCCDYSKAISVKLYLANINEYHLNSDTDEMLNNLLIMHKSVVFSVAVLCQVREAYIC